METAGTAVVARTFPRLQDGINRSVRHGSDGRKRLNHPLPIHQTTTHLRLLQKNFTEEDVPRVVGLSPRQGPLVLVVPLQQGVLIVVIEHASTSGFSRFSRRFSRGFGSFDLGVVGLDLFPHQLGHVLDFHFRTDGAEAVGDHG